MKNFKILLVGLLLSGYGALATTFYGAYFSPTRRTVVNVDKYGEADFELVLVTGTFIAGLIYLFLLLRGKGD